jgi:hypothetical protein
VLLGERLVRDEATRNFVRETRAYDPSSVDPVEILEAMMFYEAAGGLSYARLENGYQGFVDGSGWLKADRAVLVARGPQGERAAGAELRRDGQPLAARGDMRVSVLRFVLPVRQLAELSSGK